MSKNVIRDSSNRSIGYIEQQSNGDQKAYDMMNRHKGTYDRSADKTYKPNNSLVGTGNQLVMLVYDR
ncbi:MAG: hypothetical protein SGI77_11855 [Pirellulaceae bacterium]|nr:hypothetical protein [Pirellulaceae bacterium]